jgi:hypothetical protein
MRHTTDRFRCNLAIFELDETETGVGIITTFALRHAHLREREKEREDEQEWRVSAGRTPLQSDECVSLSHSPRGFYRR